MTLSTKGSAGTCIPAGVSTFQHVAFTAHGAEAVGVGSSAWFGAVLGTEPHPAFLCPRNIGERHGPWNLPQGFPRTLLRQGGWSR
jgi:hypothetical protein